MKLEDMLTKDLLVLHNELVEKPAGPKSFKTKTDLIARIRKLQPVQEATRQPETHKAEPSTKAKATSAADAPKEARKPGVGERAKKLILETGLPYDAIADQINGEIVGAKATKASVSWYASKMRKAGIEVPPRATVEADEN